MGAAMCIGILSAAMGTFSSLSSAEKSRTSQLAQAAQLSSEANMLRQQADIEKQASDREAAAIERQKSQLRRQFMDKMGENRSMLGAGNVDMYSGSAADVAEGNINIYSEDLTSLAYERALKAWQGETRQSNLRYNADVQDSQASYLKNTAGTLGTSLFSAALGGAMGFASGYTMAGGNLGSLMGMGKSASSLSASAAGSGLHKSVTGIAGSGILNRSFN